MARMRDLCKSRPIRSRISMTPYFQPISQAQPFGNNTILSQRMTRANNRTAEPVT